MHRASSDPSSREREGREGDYKGRGEREREPLPVSSTTGVATVFDRDIREKRLPW